MVSRRGGQLQEFGQDRGSGLMHGGTNRRFDGLQIENAGFAAAGEDRPQELIYFARDFLAGRFRRFFSCVDSVSSLAGRARQIRSFTSSSSWLSCRKR